MGVLLSLCLLLAKHVCSGLQALQHASCISCLLSSGLLLVVVSFLVIIGVDFGCVCMHVHTRGCFSSRVFWLEASADLFGAPIFLLSPAIMADAKLVAAAALQTPKMGNMPVQFALG